MGIFQTTIHAQKNICVYRFRQEDVNLFRHINLCKLVPAGIVHLWNTEGRPLSNVLTKYDI